MPVNYLSYFTEDVLNFNKSKNNIVIIYILKLSTLALI